MVMEGHLETAKESRLSREGHGEPLKGLSVTNRSDLHFVKVFLIAA